MRKLKVLWRSARSPRVREELETWSSVLLALGAALLLYATLKGQAAYGAEFPRDVGAPTLLFQSATGFSAAAPLETDLRISLAGVVGQGQHQDGFDVIRRAGHARSAGRNLDNTMPAGAQWQAAFPQTATPGPLPRSLGASALLAALLLFAARRNSWRTAS
jgi:hypothetical protein